MVLESKGIYFCISNLLPARVYCSSAGFSDLNSQSDSSIPRRFMDVFTSSLMSNYATQTEGGVWPAMQRYWAPEEWPPERR